MPAGGQREPPMRFDDNNPAPRYEPGHHTTHHYCAWVAAPEQASPSAPIPEPSGVFLLAAGFFVVYLAFMAKGGTR